MARYAAFLRGVNLGRNRRITNERLRGALEELGYADVATFRASGNVVFDLGAGKDPKRVLERVEAGLAESLGFEVLVFGAGREGPRVAARPVDDGRWARSSRSPLATASRGPPGAGRPARCRR
jgi:uncharacterized protein (DUF1697 family)